MKPFFSKICSALIICAFSAGLTFAAEPAKTVTRTPAKSESAQPSVTKAASAKQGLVDINSASDAELKAIPGLGDAYSAKIVVNRPYANKTQLVSRKVLPEPVYEKIKDTIIAKQPKKGDKPKADTNKK